MAGDWIKLRVDIADDPAVVRIAATLDMPEDEVVGKLHRLWSWADRHTVDGLAPGITANWVDRYIGAKGFSLAMVAVGWLSITDAAIEFPNFNRHNGESAKKRAESTLRKRLSRSERDKGVTGIEPVTLLSHSERDKSVTEMGPVTLLSHSERDKSVTGIEFDRFVFERDAYCCVYCGTQTVVPNLVCACKLCNNSIVDSREICHTTGIEPVTLLSHSERDKSVTEMGPEKRREENTPLPPETGGVSGGEPSAFVEFMARYPKKSKRQAALAEWMTLQPSANLIARLSDAINIHQKNNPDWRREGGRYVPTAAKWLRDRQWEWRPPDGGVPSTDDILRETFKRREESDRERNR